VRAASAASGLFFSQKDAALGCAFCSSGHGCGISRSDFVEVVKMLGKDGAAHKRAQKFRQEQIRNRAQLISAGGMARDVHTQAAQLLYQTPHFRTVGRNFLGDFGSADDDRGVFHQQAHDAAQPQVSRLELVRRGQFGPRGLLTN
jgi:hypothetical protein